MPYFGLNRAPAASPNVASAATVYNRCFQLMILARIRHLLRSESAVCVR